MKTIAILIPASIAFYFTGFQAIMKAIEHMNTITTILNNLPK